MEDTLKQLQMYQVAALNKGISYDLNLYVNDQSTDITVRMSYVYTGVTEETKTFCATFSNAVEDKCSKMRMGRINKFINDIDNQK